MAAKSVAPERATVVYATAPLYIGFALAHNVGDPVPAENVEPNGWEDSVRKTPPPETDE